MDLIQDLISQAQNPKANKYKRRDALENLLKNHATEPAIKNFLVEILLQAGDQNFKRDIIDKLDRYAYPYTAELIRPLIKNNEDDYLSARLTQTS